MPFTPSLPREIWIKTFRIANASRDIQQFDYQPFSNPTSTYTEDRRILLSTASVRLTLVLVCKLWRSLANELIYEEIRTSFPGEALKDALEKRGKETEADEGYGRLVRLVELPREYRYAFEILKHLPRLETIVIAGSPADSHRESTVFTPGPLPDPTPYHEMPYLKRIDWRSDRISGPRLDFLDDLLRRSPALRYLSLIGEDHFTSPRMSFPVVLPTLETLHLVNFQSRFRIRSMITKWSLPSLVHLIVDLFHLNAQEGVLSLLESFGATLHTVELGTRLPAFKEVDHVSNILANCPNICELCLSIDFFALHPNASGASSSLNTVRFYPSSYPLVDFAHLDTDSIEVVVEKAFRQLFCLYLPALQRIVLHGEWRLWAIDINSERLRSCRQTIRDRHLALCLESGGHLD